MIFKKIRPIITLLLLLAFVSCPGGTGDLNNRVIDLDAFGAQIVVLNGNPDLLFGNFCDELELEILVNEDLTPTGSTIQVQLNSASLPEFLRGCITDSDPVIISGGALLTYLAGKNFDGTPDDIGENETVTINVGVTIMTPGGDTESDFFPIVLQPVRFIAPADIDDLEVNEMGDPLFVFVTLEFQTQGIPPGTEAMCEVSNPMIGDVDSPTATVQGSLEDGFIAVQYNTENGEGGVQVVECKIVFPDPPTKDPGCDSIPEEDRTITAQVVITQTVPEPDMMMGMEDCATDGDEDMNGMEDCDDAACAGFDGDGDGCPDCTNPMGNDPDPANDGTDTDGDGLCDMGDPDDDNDGVPDGLDSAPLDPDMCIDVDVDMCDDCSVGTDDFGPMADNDPNNDGTDMDGDGVCSMSDTDDMDASVCRDLDMDTCDDCSVVMMDGGDTDNDGMDSDMDGICDANPDESLDCDDGVDNDMDMGGGVGTGTDCEDSDCDDDPVCENEANMMGFCDDGMDNDSDTLTDCADPGCDGAPCDSGGGPGSGMCTGGACV